MPPKFNSDIRVYLDLYNQRLKYYLDCDQARIFGLVQVGSMVESNGTSKSWYILEIYLDAWNCNINHVNIS